MKVTEEDWTAMERMRTAVNTSSKGPVKGDILLSNVQLVDEDAPIIWHGLQPATDRILRQALTSPEKESKVNEDKGETRHTGAAPSLIAVHHDPASSPATAIYAQNMIVVNGLQNEPIIIAAPPTQVGTQEVYEGNVLEDEDDDVNGKSDKTKNPILKGNPVMNAGFEAPTPKKKRNQKLGRNSVVHVRSFDESANGLLPYLCFPDEGGYTNGKRSTGRRLSLAGDKTPSLADNLILELSGENDEKTTGDDTSPATPVSNHPPAQPLELGLDPPIPMFAVSLDRPSTPGSIQIVSDMDFGPMSASKSPSKLPMKLVRTSDVVNDPQSPQPPPGSQRNNGHGQYLRIGKVTTAGSYGSQTTDSASAQDQTADHVQHDDHMVHHNHGHLQNVSETSEYTDQLLSQISGVLPAMSSSQVSSVLSALEPDNGIQSLPQPQNSALPAKQKRSGLALDAKDDGVKTETNRTQENGRPKKYPKKKLNYTPAECKAGDTLWYKCTGCPFLALDSDVVLRHCARAHPGGTRSLRAKLKCLACSNLFYSLQSLKVHLLYDHEALDQEVHDLLMATIEANKSWRVEAKLKLDRAALAELEETAKEMRAEDRRLEHVSKPDMTPNKPNDTQNPGFTLFDSFIDEESANAAASAVVTTSAEPEGHLGVEEGNSEVHDKAASEGVDKETRMEAESRCPKKNGKTDVQQESKPRHRKQDTLFVNADGLPKKLQEIKIEKDNALRCNIFGCSAKFILPTNMDYHKHCHKGLKWKCPECDIVASTWHSLSLHLWRQHAIDMELYSCDQCPFKTNSLRKLMNLHTKVHSEERPFLCDICGKGFKTTKQLRNHKSIHRAKEKTTKREVQCNVCQRMFFDMRMLRHHTDIVHRKLRPFLCSTCGHAASSRSSLRMHARSHTGEKPYICTECDYTTGDHNSMRRHKMRHSGAKHYTCPHCPYACIQSSTYKAHLKRKHPGLDDGLMFSCRFCPFRTVKRDNLLAHISTHPQHDDNQPPTDHPQFQEQNGDSGGSDNLFNMGQLHSDPVVIVSDTQSVNNKLMVSEDIVNR